MKVTTNTHTESDDGKNGRRNNVSANELKLQQLDRRDNTFKGFLLVVLVLAVTFNVISAIQLRHELNRTRQETNVARAANTERQNKIVSFIQCSFLIQKKYPDVNFQALNYEQSKPYLIDCSKNAEELL